MVTNAQNLPIANFSQINQKKLGEQAFGADFDSK